MFLIRKQQWTLNEEALQQVAARGGGLIGTAGTEVYPVWIPRVALIADAVWRPTRM